MHFSMQAARLREKFDVIHSHERVSAFDVLTIHCPTFIGGYLGDRTGMGRLWRLLKGGISPRLLYYIRQESMQFTHRRGRRFIAVSRHVMNDVLRHYPLSETDFDLAYPGVNAEGFRPASEEERASSRERFGLPRDRLVIAFVGSEFARKGLGAMVEAMGHLRGKPVQLLVAGGGDPGPYLKKATELGVANQVTFLGLVSDVNVAYAASDIYALPTLSDPCPMAPLEAMACGLPVILSNAGVTGVAEHIRNDEAILLEDPRSGDEIAGAIKRFLDPEIRSRYAERGRSLAQSITWDETASRTFESYQRSIAERKNKSRD
jgi:UDP-glucose:(heptosyl)LPS alpha-1,3-glucosyltransferase